MSKSTGYLKARHRACRDRVPSLRGGSRVSEASDMAPTSSLIEADPSHTNLADAVASLPGSRRDTNERHNLVTSAFVEDLNRYVFDGRITRGGAGWQQWNTHQDASYFGVWVHRDLRQILTFAEGDITVVECPDDEHFRAEIESMERLYGDAPPAATAYGPDGSVTHFYSSRLSAASLCLALIVSLLSGCRGAPPKTPESAEITDLTCGRSCLVSQAGPSTVVWISE